MVDGGVEGGVGIHCVGEERGFEGVGECEGLMEAKAIVGSRGEEEFAGDKRATGIPEEFGEGREDCIDVGRCWLDDEHPEREFGHAIGREGCALAFEGEVEGGKGGEGTGKIGDLGGKGVG